MGDTGKRVGRSVVHSSFREKHGKSGCSRPVVFFWGWHSLPPSSPPLCTVHALIRATGIQATNLSVAPGLAVAAAFVLPGIFRIKESACTFAKRVDADNTALVDLWERSVRATHDFLSEADIVELYPQVRDLYLPAVEVWVLVDDDGVAQGFIGLNQTHVEMLFVEPGCAAGVSADASSIMRGRPGRA